MQPLCGASSKRGLNQEASHNGMTRNHKTLTIVKSYAFSPQAQALRLEALDEYLR
jgi:hypothetical protein